MKRVIVASWVVVTVCLAILLQCRVAIASDVKAEAKANVGEVQIDVIHLDTTNFQFVKWVKQNARRTALSATRILTGTHPGSPFPDGPYCPGCPWNMGPTNFVVNIVLPENLDADNTGAAIHVSIAGYRLPDDAETSGEPVIFIANGSTTPTAPPVLSINSIASRTPPTPWPPCLYPCCFDPEGPCMPAEPIEPIINWDFSFQVND